MGGTCVSITHSGGYAGSSNSSLYHFCPLIVLMPTAALTSLYCGIGGATGGFTTAVGTITAGVVCLSGCVRSWCSALCIRIDHTGSVPPCSLGPADRSGWGGHGRRFNVLRWILSRAACSAVCRSRLRGRPLLCPQQPHRQERQPPQRLIDEHRKFQKCPYLNKNDAICVGFTGWLNSLFVFASRSKIFPRSVTPVT